MSLRSDYADTAIAILLRLLPVSSSLAGLSILVAAGFVILPTVP